MNNLSLNILYIINIFNNLVIQIRIESTIINDLILSLQERYC